MRIKLTVSGLELHARLSETPTVSRLAEALPCSSKANTWGDEVYFRVPVETGLEPDATDVVEPGTICFWVEGSSLAIPFGPTPVSTGDECRLVARVNILGNLEEDPTLLGQVKSGDSVQVELV